MNKIDELYEIFFGVQSGHLPKKYKDLQAQYQKDKESTNCFACISVGLMNRYRQLIKKVE